MRKLPFLALLFILTLTGSAYSQPATPPSWVRRVTFAQLPVTPATGTLRTVTDTDGTGCNGSGAIERACQWNGSAWVLFGDGGGGSGDFTDVNGTANEITSSAPTGPATTLSIADTFRITGKTVTAPVKTGITAPATCTVGDLFYDTDATAGQNLFGCTATNVWTLLGDGGAGGGDNISVNGTAAADADFDNAIPAAPANSANVRWQKDALTPNNLSAHLLFSDVGAATFGAGAGFAWTFDAGATDPVITFGSGTLNVSTGTLQQGGTAVVLQSRTLTGGAGIGAIGDLSADRTIATASGETGFLASGALTCGAGTAGAMQVHTTPLQYCDNAATPVLRYGAYGDSAGAALSGDTATAFFAAGTIEVARLPVGVTTKSLTFLGGCDSCAVLADTDDQATFWRNNVAAVTITEVWCESDAGSPIINLQRDDGTPANILSANLTCSTTGATGTIDAAEDNVAVGDKIDFLMITAGGTAKRVTVNIKMTLD